MQSDRTLRSKQWLRAAGVALVSVVSLAGLSATPVHAQTLLTFSLTTAGESQDVNLSTDGGATFNNMLTGRYQGSYNGGDYFNVFCTDVFHETNIGTSFLADVTYSVTDAPGPRVGDYYAGGLSSALLSGDYNAQFPGGGLTAMQRSSQVGWLADNFLLADHNTFLSGASGSTSYGDNLTAIALSIWDINQDGADGVAAGQLQLSSAEQVRLGGLVNYYQQQAALHSDYASQDNSWIQAPRDANGAHLQDVVGPRVPEASTLALIGLLTPALSLVALRARRRAI